ncbi:MAG: NAD(P)-dependent oxidoreductase [Burkholderiales bacterium]|nr:NAD(P)-dependent oxidoreductase [Burkholderiales bacterium]
MREREIESVGVVGIGAMGMGVAMRLLSQGWSVWVRDIRPEAEDEVRAAGARVATTPAGLASHCDAVITLVVDDAQTEAVVFGPDGVASAARPGTVLIVASTLPPGWAAGAAPRLHEQQIDLIEAPCSGGPAKAHGGEMSMMLAAPAAVLQRCERLLDTISGKRFVVSENQGDAAKAKLVNNMLAGVNLVAACEAFVLGLKLGLEAQQLFDLVQASSGGSWIFSDRMPRVLRNDYAARARLDILKKDLSLLLDVAKEQGYSAPLAQAAHGIFVRASEMGLGDLDDAAIAKGYAGWEGVSLARRQRS